MIGRRVRDRYDAAAGEGTVTKWDPLGASMCDALVQFDNGRECAFSSRQLDPVDGKGPLPSRDVARRKADEESLRSLQEIRAQHVRDFRKPWPGAEFGKVHVGQMLDGAIAEVKERLGRK